MKTEREMFEQWIKSRYPNASIAPRVNNCGITCDDSYAHPKIDFAWEAWQARAKAVAAPTSPVSTNSDIRDAERYRWLRFRVSAHGVCDAWEFGFPTYRTLPAPPMAMRTPDAGLDEAIDAAMSAEDDDND